MFSGGRRSSVGRAAAADAARIPLECAFLRVFPDLRGASVEVTFVDGSPSQRGLALSYNTQWPVVRPDKVRMAKLAVSAIAMVRVQ